MKRALRALAWPSRITPRKRPLYGRGARVGEKKVPVQRPAYLGFSRKGTHGLHEIHILLGGMYLVPIIAAALWFGLWGGLVTTAAISLAYYAHIRLSWPNQPMENANQFAMIVVYWIVGTVAGVLVNLETQERERRLKAEREAIIQGIAGLSNALGFRDEYTRKHSEHVSRLAVQIGERLGLSDEKLDLVRLAGLVHDVG